MLAVKFTQLEFHNFSITQPINLNSITFGRHGLKMIWFSFGVNWMNGLGWVRKSKFFRQFKMADSKFSRPWPNWYHCSRHEPRNLARQSYDNGQKYSKAISIFWNCSIFFNNVLKQCGYPQVMMPMIGTKFGLNMLMQYRDIASCPFWHDRHWIRPHVIWEQFGLSKIVLIIFCHHGLMMFWANFG